jgi:hypothetical protein
MAAGILLLSRARSLGQRLRVEIVGDPEEIGVVNGPAILHSPAVASCGVGRELGSGAVVVVPGPADEPVMVSLSPDGRRDWFKVDRKGDGVHPATQGYVALSRSSGPAARELAREIVRSLEALGCAPEPAVLDLLFGAPVPPLTRISVALRAGRALSGERGLPINLFLADGAFDDDSPGPLGRGEAISRLEPVLGGRVDAFLRAADALEGPDHASAEVLVRSLTEVLVHLALLPRQAILPPLDPAADAVAFHLGRALRASVGNPQAQTGLVDTYRFLGGRFVAQAEHAVDLPGDLPPGDRLARWEWFCTHVSEAATRMERIWRDLMDPPM